MEKDFEKQLPAAETPKQLRTLDEIERVFAAANEHRDYAIYTGAMDAALEAKAQTLLPYFEEISEGDVIVDAGSGTGKLAELVAREFSHARVYALDISHELHERAKEIQALTQLIYGDAQEKIFPDNSVAVKYFSSVGHEIESFGGSMRLAVETAFRELRPGGQLIMRDFAKPSRSQPVFMRLLNTAGIDRPEADYVELSTTALFKRFAKEFQGGNIFPYEQAARDGISYFKLSPELAHEFYLRKDYTANWRQEIKEKYTYWTPEETKHILEEIGYVNVRVIPELNPWIYEHRLENQIALYEETAEGTLQPIDFPPTHMVVIAEKPKDISSVVEAQLLPEGVDYKKLLATIELREEEHIVKIGDREFRIDPKSRRQGTKKICYALEDDPTQVIKFARGDTLNLHSVFRSFQQTIESQDILDTYQVPRAKILDWDGKEENHHGPPYCYFLQECVASKGPLAADLIRRGEIIEEDVKQMAEMINKFEDERVYQIDTNPFNWYRVTDEDGKTTMVYGDGKVYCYDEQWQFKYVGLLQWLNPDYVEKARDDCAAIPTRHAFEELQVEWDKRNDNLAQWWKKYLKPVYQP